VTFKVGTTDVIEERDGGREGLDGARRVELEEGTSPGVSGGRGEGAPCGA
jgi:hypothetical protein